MFLCLRASSHGVICAWEQVGASHSLLGLGKSGCLKIITFSNKEDWDSRFWCHSSCLGEGRLRFQSGAGYLRLPAVASFPFLKAFFPSSGQPQRAMFGEHAW